MRTFDPTRHRRIVPVRRAGWMLRHGPAALLATAVGFLLACAGGPAPYVPQRPAAAPDGPGFVPKPPPDPFPERTILEPIEESPPATIERIERMFAEMDLAVDPDPRERSRDLDAEIDSIRAALDHLDLGAGLLLRDRLGSHSDADRDRLRRAAGLYLRWGMALIRSGQTDKRVWGAEKLRQAVEWDPGNPIPVLVLGAYYENAGYASHLRDLLESYTAEHGHEDRIDLQRIRKQEREWKVTRFGDELARALTLGHELAGRKGGWGEAPPWLHLEQARLLFLADSLRTAEHHARRAVDGLDPRTLGPGEARTAAFAELLLGVLQARRLEFESAAPHFERAAALAAATPGLGMLAGWLGVPWDLWTREAQASYDRATDQAARIVQFWGEHDPILATPEILEDQIAYHARVGEAWFLLDGVDPGAPGPLTDPGRVILRYGVPRDWTSVGAQPHVGFSGTGFDVNRTWRFEYMFPASAAGAPGDLRAWAGPPGPGIGASALPSSWHRESGGILERLTEPPKLRPITVLFQDRGSESRFVAVDTLRGPAWPPFLFDYGFDGKGYRLSTAITRFRQPDGRIRLVLAYDTYLPEYSIRYPLSGLRFDGHVDVRTTLWRNERRSWRPGPQVRVRLDHEVSLAHQWTFRRRSGFTQVNDLDPANLRVASLLTLRDADHRITAMGVDNGEPGKLQGFGWSDLEASDLLLVTSFGTELPEDRDRLLRPGLVAFGADLYESALVPRAGRHFLPGEDIGFYLEVYNLDTRDRVTDAELLMSLERLQDDGSLDYAVLLRGQAQTLVRFGINQWNIVRSLGLSTLAPGRYRLRAAVLDRKGSQRVERIAEFRVVTPDELVELYGWQALEAPEKG